jgi:hypothetical protein
MPVVLLLLLLLLSSEASAQAVPKVHLLYPENATVFDRNCPSFTKTELNPLWLQETARRRAEFQTQWDTEGPKYLDAVLAEVGLDFPYREMQGYDGRAPMTRD